MPPPDSLDDDPTAGWLAAQAAASAAVAPAVGAEAAFLASSLPAAVALGAAALLAGLDPARARLLPRTERATPAAIALQRGHMGTVGGAPITQLLRLAGARPRAAGTVGRCATPELEAALEGSAAALFDLRVGGGGPDGGADLVPLAAFGFACRGAGRPFLVLDPGAGAIEAALDAGAALVLFGAAALGPGEAGVLAATRDAARAVALQLRGIGAALAASPSVCRTVAAAALAWQPVARPLPPLAVGPRPADAGIAAALRFPER